MSKPSKEIDGDKPPVIRVAAPLNTAITLGAAVLVGAMSGAKRPVMGGD